MSQDEIIRKHAEAARQEIEAEQARSNAARTLAEAQAREEALGAEFVLLAKNATRNKPRMDELTRELSAVKGEISKANSALEVEAAQYQPSEQETARRDREAQAVENQAGGRRPAQHFEPQPNRVINS